MPNCLKCRGASSHLMTFISDVTWLFVSVHPPSWDAANLAFKIFFLGGGANKFLAET